MTTDAPTRPAALVPVPTQPVLSTKLTLLLATACGLIVANVYYAQPLAGPLSALLGLSPAAAGLVVTTTQAGYGIGLLLIVPLGDLVENRRLVVSILGLAMMALLGAGLATGPGGFLLASLLIGLGSVAVQVLVPYAAHLAPDATRGRAVGNVMGGLMAGIMLARPAASLVAAAWSPRAVFLLSAVIMAGVATVLRLALPRRVPPPGLQYGSLLVSMGRLARTTPVLRRRAFYHACLFGVFSLFWTTVPLMLSERFHLSQNGIALFAFVGMAGVLAAPIAGRVADRGWTRPATGVAILTVAAGLLLGLLGLSGSSLGLLALALTAILLDLGVTGNGVLGQRAIYALAPDIRGRLNGLYMATFFVGGAVGSAVGGWAYARGGWPLATGAALIPTAAALLAFLTERKDTLP